MRKLTIKDLAPYLPYNLLMVSTAEGRPAYNMEESRRLKKIEILSPKNVELFLFLKRVPLLRPLSDLTKEIEHNGDKFVPLLNLYCLSTRFNDPDPNQFDCRQLTKEKTFFGSTYTCTRMLHSDANPCLMFSSNRGFYSYDNFGDMGSMREVADQYQLWQKLFEWQFDVNGLIPSGLAQELKTK